MNYPSKNKRILKRDGTTESFSPAKIEDAVVKAFNAVDGEVSSYALAKATNIAQYVKEQVETSDAQFSVEDIQDLVENGLMSTKRKDIAKEYIIYRENRTKIRERNSPLIKSVTKKLQARDVANQNANVEERSFGGRRGEAANEVMKKYALDYIVSKMSRDNHLNNMIYIHDLDSYALGMGNCLSIPFDDLLASGFNTRQADVRPANSINTAFQLVAVIFQLQSLQQFGGVSATHLDWTMIPYVRKSFAKHYKTALFWISSLSENEIDYEIENMLNNASDYSICNREYEIYNHKAYDYAMDMTQKELQQAVEGMYHNLK